MNRRTFVKSGIAALLGMVGLRLLPKQESVPIGGHAFSLTEYGHSEIDKGGLGSDEIDIREIIHGDIVEDSDATKVTTRFFYKGRRGKATTYISNNLLWDADFNLIGMLRELIFSDIRAGM